MAALNNITSPPDIAQDDSAVALKKVQNYLYSLQEQLRFMFSNLGVENINNSSLNELETLLTGGVKTKIQDAMDNVADLRLAADGLQLSFSDAEGNLSSLQQKVDGFTFEVTNGEDSSTITLKSGDTEIVSPAIKMDGLVTFSNLKNYDGTTEINGRNINTGVINAVDINGVNITGCTIKGSLFEALNDNDNNYYGTVIDNNAVKMMLYDSNEDKYTDVMLSFYYDGYGIAYIGTHRTDVDLKLEGARALNICSDGKLDLTSNDHGIRVNYNEGSPLVVPIQYGVNPTDGITNKIDLGCSSYRFKGIYLNNAPNVESDERAKKEINDIDAKQACAFVDALNVVSYLYKTDDDDHKKRIGLLAGKMKEIDPAFADFFVDEDEKQMLSLRPSDLVFALIPKIQSQQKTIDELKDKVMTQQQTIADLFVNVEALKSRIALL